MNDLDQLLRGASARLRDTAPSAEATETALAGLHDVRLDEGGPARRRRLWIIAPAVLAAAVTLGVLVLTRPNDEAIRPAETTAVPTPTTLSPTPTVPSTVPTTVPAPVTVPATAPVSSATTPATAAPDEVELLGGVRLRTTDVDFDGDGGACLTVLTATSELRGCVDGPTRRGAYGRPLHMRVDDVPAVLFPTGIDGSGRPEMVIASTTASPCTEATADLGQMVEEASCGDGVAIARALPTTPGAVTNWSINGAQGLPDDTGVELVQSSESAGARVFLSTPIDDVTRCLIVASRDNVVREACQEEPTWSFLAGSVGAPLVVEHDGGRTLLTALDATSTMAVAGCADVTASDLVLLMSPHGMMSALLCGGDGGAANQAPVRLHPGPVDGSIDVFARDAEGQLALTDSGTGIDCETATPAGLCDRIGITDFTEILPFPSATTITAFDEALGGGAALTSRNAIDVVGDLPTAGTVSQMADGLAVLLREIADPEQQIDVIGDSTPIVIRQTNLDDSVTATIYVIATTPVQGDPSVIMVSRLRAFDVCGRGVTTVDDQTVCV